MELGTFPPLEGGNFPPVRARRPERRVGRQSKKVVDQHDTLRNVFGLDQIGDVPSFSGRASKPSQSGVHAASSKGVDEAEKYHLPAQLATSSGYWR